MAKISPHSPVHVCTLQENFVPESQLNSAVLFFNFLTLVTVLSAQIYFGYREWWCIESFDFDDALPNDNLQGASPLHWPGGRAVFDCCAP